MTKRTNAPKRAKMEDYKILHTFTVLYAGWELDHKAWIAENKVGKRVLLMTDHGSLWDYGQDVSPLHGHIAEAEQSIAGIQKAIKLVNG